MTYHLFKTIFENNLLNIEINKLARQTDSSILISYKDSVILSIAVTGKTDTSLNYLPLTVLYQEKFYSVGKIPGNFNKREGKSSEHEILNSRLIDRSLRPLINNNFKKEIQIINTILSSDHNCNNEIFALLGSSLSLLISSNIPFFEPVSAVCIGRIKNEFIINPSLEQKKESDFLLILSGTKESLNMLEATSNEISEDVLLEAMIFGHESIKKLCLLQEDIKNKINPLKKDIPEIKLKTELFSRIEKKYSHLIKDIFINSCEQKNSKKILQENILKLKDKLLTEYEEDCFLDDKNSFVIEKKKIDLINLENIFNNLLKQEFRKIVIQDKKRVDGRELDEIRDIQTQINLLPRVHGSSLFTRGETQSLSVVTLGTLRESKMIDDLTEKEEKRFILHYNFPHFSVGEIGRYIAPSRREIGHGMLAEKALSCVLPSEEKFPYSIRVVSEILESNGSSSQATVCASSMALMDAGVPLKRAVAGIAMGLFFSEKEYVILSDIQGLEDQYGDMDFKISGTEKGITALQMDIKIKKINFDILKESLQKARLGITRILQKMALTISKSNHNLSIYAPKVKVIHVKTNKIRDIIGPGGKIISKIIEDNDNVIIDIKTDGKIFITHHNIEIVEKTAKYIINLTQDITIGLIYLVTVLKILSDKNSQSFGAIVEIFPGIEGFIHVSNLSNKRTEHVEDVLNVGDKIFAKCIEINNKGKIFLSLKNLKE
ncbi:MAG: polyribonucleotide nucleotidyltransferase [Candidatus Phytoplasma stylosanthis]|uniref:polyribonucleotide nucleotidyltransferase n=1 Tax=Candidatus Phytoplasma stylosanthis TaxID=2798314 RepID=UPI00293A7A0E|nr:polyribonucleotide nucleotidyltransferase [Candidatus Phytoplasma stylosanthis]MDV3168183.1 polyribonucleotide nucleotidyltransferase [Candidatus Phytoplasma stylosanthis]MDV3170980.1 polyribonucleotide nucleotidyltransferase [Candidatus Phytoplasma stylosanthis]MDV3173763.1 polyribonucleotide nucleotidyltransferase [Candidatus Phytoplasma stylosanthis]MDV3174296.1 polyribonucleotide nucleotidyltransferase [Candidatus Phytoplasma stylosanthis]MDV3202479.1 polyribonucleotide nucleotidyltrans